MFCNNSLHPCYKRSFHNQPSVAFAAESERLGGTCASLLENVRINRCSRYLNAYAVGPGPRSTITPTFRRRQEHSFPAAAVWMSASAVRPILLCRSKLRLCRPRTDRRAGTLG
ncbi:protein of unknown function [Bradyrhizobium vignae]|uniref:Uncharacterized protein n=1 Tax=Bradyrhizobium vignae TaxID=1549949 RepID=A0A2U3Q5U7_9BRAD|nr:protein of unknown function [Bradyrhizobium vignae]